MDPLFELFRGLAIMVGTFMIAGVLAMVFFRWLPDGGFPSADDGDRWPSGRDDDRWDKMV